MCEKFESIAYGVRNCPITSSLVDHDLIESRDPVEASGWLFLSIRCISPRKFADSLGLKWIVHLKKEGTIRAIKQYRRELEDAHLLAIYLPLDA
jgi:hypothetical protein